MENTESMREARGAGYDTGEAARRRRGALFWLPIIVAAAVVAALVAALLRPANDNPLSLVNGPAPDFTMSLYGGGTLHLAALRGKTVVVNFWWSGCDPCKQEAPILEREWRAWKDKGVVFVGVDEQDTAEPAGFLRAYDVTYPTGPDPNYVSIQYHTTGQPETFFISPRGIITHKYAQPFPDEATLAGLIQEARS